MYFIGLLFIFLGGLALSPILWHCIDVFCPCKTCIFRRNVANLMADKELFRQYMTEAMAEDND